MQKSQFNNSQVLPEINAGVKERLILKKKLELKKEWWEINQKPIYLCQI